MAGRQGPAGRERAQAGALSALQVVVHDVVQARAALAAAEQLGVPVELRSAPGAAGYAGVGYLHALEKALGRVVVVDCGDDAGLVLAALRTGCRQIAFDGPASMGAKLKAIAAQAGAELRLETDPPATIRCMPDDDPLPALRARLGLQKRP